MPQDAEIPPARETPKEQLTLTEIEWIEWTKTNLGVDFTGAAQRNYRQNTTVARVTVQNHPFFTGIEEFLRNCDVEYGEETEATLFMRAPKVDLEQKSYESAVNKAYRQNYVRNKSFPNPPRGGWYTPDNWFSKLNDIIRGTIVCKYIDGPRFLAERLEEYARLHGLKGEFTSQQRDEGYYAYHFYVKVPVELIDLHWNSVTVELIVEIQVTTQLQEILYKITHRYFEETRNQRISDRVAWKWDVTSNRFKAGYLSHTLHLLEAIIMELRDSKSADAETLLTAETLLADMGMEDDNG